MRTLAAVIATLITGCAADGGPPGEPPPHQAPPFTVGGFRIEVPPVTLAPTQELEPCFIFPIELDGPSSIVGGAVLTTPPGMHHGNITTRPATGTGIRPCPDDNGDPGTDLLAGGSVLFASSTQISGEEWYSFPEGEGYRVRADHEIVARMHYLNTTDGPITVAPTYQWFTIDETKLVHQLAPFAWNYGGFEIPAGADFTGTGDCRFPEGQQMHVVTLLPHMHKLGRAMSAEYRGGDHDGERFLDSPGYDPGQGVLRQYDPPIDLSVAGGVRFSCTWENTLDHTVVEGIGENEMCIVFGYAWPIDQSFTTFATEASCLVAATPAQ